MSFCIIGFLFKFSFINLFFLYRQYLDLAKKVEDEAKRFSTLIHSRAVDRTLSMPTLLPGDLKGCFSIYQKDIFSVSISDQLEYCKKWLHALSVLGLELLRPVNPLNLADMTKLESSEYALQEKNKSKMIKLVTGQAALSNSTSGLSCLGSIYFMYVCFYVVHY